MSKIERFRPQHLADPCRERLTLDDDLFYNDKQVARFYGGVHPVTIWKWAKAGIIPKPAKLGPNISRWGGRDIRRDLEKKCGADTT